MSGIAGWLDFDRDLERERDTAQAMTRTLARRGPDAEGLWVDSHIALGHRRLAVIDVEGGTQPMTVEHDGRTLAVLTFDGEIYNFRELRQDLASRGHAFRTNGDTEVVLRAYLEWGAECASKLNGMYAFAVWDPRREELVLTRDRMGIKPLYYYPTPSGLLFGSEPKAILANPRAEAAVDSDGLRELLSMVKTPGHAVFRGMRELKPGHVLRVWRGGSREESYWELAAYEHRDDVDTTVRTVRELLDDIVPRQLVSDVPVGSLLSGGLDSSVITALAAQAHRAGDGGRVRSFAVEFAGQAENFQADEIRETPDAPYIADVARHVDVDHSDVVLDTAGLMDPETRSAVLRARDLPAGLGDLDTSLYLLFAAVRQSATVGLSGESADEVFGGYAWFHDPEAVNADTFPWYAAMRRLAPNGIGDMLLDPGLMARLDLPSYIDDRYREALAEVPRLDGENRQERRMREVSYLHLSRFLRMLLDRMDRMSMASGLQARVPICDHRLVEYVFNAPWSMKTYDGQEKSLLRGATSDLLPQSVVERRKVPYPSTQDPAYGQVLRDEFGKLLARGDAAIQPLLDGERARAALEESGDPATLAMRRWSLERLLAVNEWLERYNVRVDT